MIMLRSERNHNFITFISWHVLLLSLFLLIKTALVVCYSYSCETLIAVALRSQHFSLVMNAGSVYTGVDFCKRLCGVSVIRRYISNSL